MRSMTFLSLILFSFPIHAQDFRDTLFDKQWALKNIGQEILTPTGELSRSHKKGIQGIDLGYISVDAVTEKELQSKEVIVAVIDSGVDIHHPDLLGRIWHNKKKCPIGNEKDLPCHGWNFADRNADISDKIGHGTHVAGIIAANHNDIGIAGLAHSNVKIMPLKVITKDVNDFIYKGKVITDIFADAIRFAIENGAKVINMSLGWPKLVETPKIKIAINMAIEKNISIVVATGNNGKDVPTYPCSYEGVICVGSHDNRGDISDFSNHGGKVDLLAPGEFIVSTYPLNIESRSLRIQGYESKKGTSQAAPFVSATVANLIVSKENISQNEIQARLYSASIRENGQEGRYSLHGRLNHKKSLEDVPNDFIAPMFKNLMDVQLLGDGKLIIPVDLKNYLSDTSDIEVTATINSPQITLEKSTFKINSISQNKIKSIKINASLENTNIDAHFKLTLLIKTPSSSRRFSTAIVINRYLTTDSSAQTIPLSNTKAEHVAYFTKKKKGSFLRKVIDKHLYHQYPEFYYFPQLRENDYQNLILLQNNGEGLISKEIMAPNNSKVISLLRRDFNFDGKYDYLLYSKNLDNNELYFQFFNQDLSPLYGKNSTWVFPISLFGGLPEDRFTENFHWIKKKSQVLGNVLVPVITKVWEMPEKDNSDDIIDRIEGSARHIYYLNPVNDHGKISLQIRVIDDYNFYQKIREEFFLFADQEINLSTPFPQTKEDIDKGQIRFNVSIGQEFEKVNYSYQFTEVGVSTRKSEEQMVAHIDGNSLYPIYKLNSEMSVHSNGIFMALFNRAHGRISQVSRNKGEVSYYEFKSSGWNDPIFGYIGAFKGHNKPMTTFVETRYSVNVLEDGHLKAKLPINRDSSFPGVSFAETYSPIVIKGEDSLYPGLYINSTLVYGDRIYSMVWENGKFIRPANLSIIIPKHCMAMEPVQWGAQKEFHYSLMCYNKELKIMEMKLYPIEL